MVSSQKVKSGWALALRPNRRLCLGEQLKPRLLITQQGPSSFLHFIISKSFTTQPPPIKIFDPMETKLLSFSSTKSIIIKKAKLCGWLSILIIKKAKTKITIHNSLQYIFVSHIVQMAKRCRHTLILIVTIQLSPGLRNLLLD